MVPQPPRLNTANARLTRAKKEGKFFGIGEIKIKG
jgi:hypothetical protein